MPKARGFTLIEVLVTIFILVILSLGIYSLFEFSLKILAENRAREGALALANQKIEILRNLPYEKIGTVGGIPYGSIAAQEQVTRNNVSYTVNTQILYIDDPFDEVAPTDLVPNDYKRARVEVVWPKTVSKKNSLFLISDFSPKGIEGNENGGTLVINVFDASGLPLAQANVSVINQKVTPAINFALQTPIGGEIIIPGAPSCPDCYEITASKNGYSTDRTYTADEVFYPAKPLVSVIEGEKTSVGFSIDKLSSLTITSPEPDLSFAMEGEKIIGQKQDLSYVKKYFEVLSVNEEGNLIINNLEGDSYSISIDGAATGYDLAGSNPYLPFNLEPGTSQTIALDLTPHADHTFLVTILDPGQVPVVGAQVKLSNLDLAYNETKMTGVAGQVFFTPLQTATYTVNVTAPGFVDYTFDILISGQTQEKANLSLL